MNLFIEPMSADEAKDVQHVAGKLRLAAVLVETAIRSMVLLRKRSGVVKDFRRELDEVAIVLNHVGFATGLIDMAEEPGELRHGRDDAETRFTLSFGASRSAKDVRESFAAAIYCLADVATSETASAQVWGFVSPDICDAFLALKKIDELLARVKRA